MQHDIAKDLIVHRTSAFCHHSQRSFAVESCVVVISFKENSRIRDLLPEVREATSVRITMSDVSFHGNSERIVKNGWCRLIIKVVHCISTMKCRRDRKRRGVCFVLESAIEIVGIASNPNISYRK